MKITLTGTHSVGKTTLLKELQKQRCLEKYTFVSEMTRKLPKNKINSNGTDEIQRAIMQMHVDNIKLKNCILDRGVFDGVAYTGYLNMYGNVSDEMFEKAYDIFFQLVSEYDIVFYIPIEFQLVPDGVREEGNWFFREWVDTRINAVTKQFKDYYKLVKVRGNLKERVKICLKAIKELD